jgi:hypothetical protein
MDGTGCASALPFQQRGGERDPSPPPREAIHKRTASHETLQPEFAIVDDLRNLQILYNHTVPCAGLMAIRALSQSCLWHGNTDEVGCAPSDGASQSITLAGIKRGPGDLSYLQTG